MADGFLMRALTCGGLLLLAACSSSQQTDVAPKPEPAITSEPLQPLETGPLSAAQISKALAEKTFSFSSPGRAGSVTYYSDGTFEYDESGKGSGTGVWQSADGKLCEARNPTSFLPKATPSVCTPFTSDGTRYIAGTMQLIPR